MLRRINYWHCDRFRARHLVLSNRLGAQDPCRRSRRRPKLGCNPKLPRRSLGAGYNQTPSERLTSCLASEQRTREELNKNWSTFPADDRISCVKSLTFAPTYTELLTCLEMRRDVRNLRGAKPADTNPR